MKSYRNFDPLDRICYNEMDQCRIVPNHSWGTGRCVVDRKINKSRMTRVLLLAFAACLAMPFGNTVLAQQIDEKKVAVADSHVVKLKEAESSSEFHGFLNKGDMVVILDESNPDYLLVSMHEQKFYVPANQVKVISVQETYTPGIRARVRAEDVNVRAKPTIDAQIVCMLKKGTLVDVSQKVDNWYKVSTGKTFGYISSEYLQMHDVEPETAYLTLTMGMSGTEVKRLQQELSRRGYLDGRVNGTYGAKTRDAVKHFQAEQGVLADGIARPDVQKMLYGEK